MRPLHRDLLKFYLVGKTNMSPWINLKFILTLIESIISLYQVSLEQSSALSKNYLKIFSVPLFSEFTAQKMKFFVKALFSKCQQIPRKLRIY